MWGLMRNRRSNANSGTIQRGRRRFLVVLLSIVAMTMSLGCHVILKPLGFRIETLVGRPVLSLGLELLEEQSLCPGESGQLVVVADLGDGNPLLTIGAEGGRVLWNAYKLSASGGTISGPGVLRLSPDPMETWSEPASITVHAVAHSRLKGQLEVPARYDCDYLIDLSGSGGTDGTDGSSGDDGTPGGPGPAGGPGDDVQIQAYLVRHPVFEVPLVEFEVRSLSRPFQRTVVVDPRGGRLAVVAEGGRGGRGGEGGAGGAGGPGGRFTVFVSEAAEPYLPLITLLNDGGDGGDGSPPGPRGAPGPPPSVRIIPEPVP